MMNYIILYHGQNPAIIHKEDKEEYIKALEESRKIENSMPIRKFLYIQQIKHSDLQIKSYNSRDKGISLLLWHAQLSVSWNFSIHPSINHGLSQLLASRIILGISCTLEN